MCRSRLSQNEERRTQRNFILRTSLFVLRSGWLPIVLLFTAISLGGEVECRLTNGQRLFVDDIRSNADHAVLIVQRQQLRLERSIAWDRIESVKIDGRPVSVNTLRAAAKQSALGETKRSVPIIHVDHTSRDGLVSAVPVTQSYKSCVGSPPPLATKGTVIGIRRDPLDAYRDTLNQHFPHGVPIAETGFALHLMRERKAQDVLSRDEKPPAANPPAPGNLRPVNQRRRAIRSITVSAKPVSDHGLTDWDSLAVGIRAMDRDGNETSVRGTLRITLRGQRQRIVHAYGPYFFGQPGRVQKIGSWTRSIDTGKSPKRPVELVLPLPQPSPEHDLRWASFGELHVQLLVPGEGVFETTQRNVVLRHVSETRDRNLIENGSRFFSDETTFGSRASGGIHLRSVSTIRPESRIFTVQP